MEQRLKPARELAFDTRGMKFLNDADLVLWNMDKATYLKDLRQAGFEVPETTFLHQTARCGSAKGLTDAVTSLDVCKAGCPVVVKPSISAPAKLTHLLRDPQTLSDQDVTFFDHLLSAKLQNSLMAQAFEPTIANGEYSLIFLAGKHSHTILKSQQQVNSDASLSLAVASRKCLMI